MLLLEWEGKKEYTLKNSHGTQKLWRWCFFANEWLLRSMSIFRGVSCSCMVMPVLKESYRFVTAACLCIGMFNMLPPAWFFIPKKYRLHAPLFRGHGGKLIIPLIQALFLGGLPWKTMIVKGPERLLIYKCACCVNELTVEKCKLNLVWKKHALPQEIADTWFQLITSKFVHPSYPAAFSCTWYLPKKQT